MAIDMKGKNLVSINDLSREEVNQILETAEIIKLRHYSHEEQPLLKGKVLGMIFQKPSLRTRVSFETGMIQLGRATTIMAMAPFRSQLIVLRPS